MSGMQHIALFHEQPTRIPTSSSNTPNSPTILHPTSPDPIHALSCRIYDFSRQIDEFILDLQQNAPSLPTIYYHPILFTENLEKWLPKTPYGTN